MIIFGVHGDLSFERYFYRHGNSIQMGMMREYRFIIQKSLMNEISLTVQDIYRSFKKEIHLKRLMQMIKEGRLDDLDDNITPIPLDVSYGMEWQKRAGGRVYDSLSGHG